MNIGLTQRAVGMHRDAVDSLTSGIDGLPVDQQNAEWLDEYRRALDYAEAATDGPHRARTSGQPLGVPDSPSHAPGAPSICGLTGHRSRRFRQTIHASSEPVRRYVSSSGSRSPGALLSGTGARPGLVCPSSSSSIP